MWYFTDKKQSDTTLTDEPVNMYLWAGFGGWKEISGLWRSVGHGSVNGENDEKTRKDNQAFSAGETLGGNWA